MQIKRQIKTGLVLAMAGAIWIMGKKGLPAAYIEQDSWRLISARQETEGIFVQIAGENLMLQKGVQVAADSQESKDFSADFVRDGISQDAQLRWSSENNWEDTRHWLEVSFPRPEKIGLVRIYWERDNALSYALEYSADGQSWQTAARFTKQPEALVQDIFLEEPVEASYLRLQIEDVAKREEDLSLYYQNISILELEAYEGIQESFVIERPAIEAGSGRQLEIPSVPADYSLSFAGADYEMLIASDGRIADTLADTWVELGFVLEKDGVKKELPGMTVKLPGSEAATGQESEKKSDAAREAAQSGEAYTGGSSQIKAALPADFLVKEWLPRGGSFRLPEKLQIVYAREAAEALEDTAALFAAELTEVLGQSIQALDSEQAGNMAEAVDIELVLLSAADGLGEEGFEIRLGEGMENNLSAAGGHTADMPRIQICGNTQQAIRWGCVSFLELLEKTGGELPVGRLRDYPKYEVRGFGIDVGRRAISMELLYDIVREMSLQKMNTLQIHLNDNQIISQSEYDGTAEGARRLYAGFRLESDLHNEAGESLTSADLYYSKQEFAQLIRDAAAYGVEIVPEIDTPAHSLAFTRLFPELGLNKDPESVDQLDLSKPEARELIKGLWAEYLNGPGAVFEDCSAVHIGMDEYFGEEKAYLSYLEELAAYVKELAPQKEIRIWGSLSKLEEDHSQVPRTLQMHIWDTSWADPLQMYEEGFSVINSLSSSLYLIPGGGYDWLDTEFLEERWQPNIFETAERTWVLPAYSEKMLGACYMMWNDWSHLNGDEITEKDLLARFLEPLPAIAGKLWGKS